MKETQNPFTIFGGILKKYNTTLFIILIVGSLSFCIMVLTNISQRPLDSSLNNTGAYAKVTFNAVAVDHITKLRVNGSDPGKQTLPTGRINPFAE